MIRYLARSLPVFLRAAATRERTLVSLLERRVGLGDLDVNVHMNQAVYAQVMELSRADWALRSGAWQAWRKARVWPVVAEQRIVYRRELKVGQRYTLDTRAVGFEGRLLSCVTHLLVGDRVHARNDTKFIFSGRRAEGTGVLDAAEVEAACRSFLTAPLPVVDWVVTAR